MDVRGLIHEIHSSHAATIEMRAGLHLPYRRRGEISIPAFKMEAGKDPAHEGRATSLRLMAKAATMPVDFFFYDLEDAAPDNPEFKPFAREFAIQALLAHDFGHRVVAFRPNNIRTPYFEDDLVEVVGRAGHRLDAIVIPKTETVDEVRDCARAINAVQEAAGRTNPIWIEVLIESPRAFLEAGEIAAIPEVTALVFGAWDFARMIGGRVDAATWLQDQATARQMLPIYAAAHGKDAVDAVTGTLPIRPRKPEPMPADVYAQALETCEAPLGSDLAFAQALADRKAAIDLCARDARDARRIGYRAKWILHPDQIAPVHAAWTPTRKEALAALELAARYGRAAASGSGSEVDGVRLADKAVVGTEWWAVEDAMAAGVLAGADVESTGFTLEDLRRVVRTR